MHTADDIWWREKNCKGAAIQHFFLSSGKRYGKMKQKTIQNQTTKRKRDHDMKYMLNEKKQYLTNVRGNCDAEVDQMVLEFPVLADYGILIEGGHTFYMSHGHIYNEQNLPPLMDGDIFLYGHTHVLRAEKKGAHTFLNPGSVSLPKEGNIPTYAILEDGVFTIKGFDGTVVKQLTL